MNPDVTFAVVRTQRVGFHNWPGAPADRSYLRDRHRHVFHIEAAIEVQHDDREIEYHDLLDVVYAIWPPSRTELEHRSCEMLASELADGIALQWPGRPLEVSVFEDGEVGAVLSRA